MYLTIKDLNKSYGSEPNRVTVINHLDLAVEQGQIVVFLGPSGCGKSTLLNVIGGIDRADSGEVWVDGKDIARLSAKELIAYRRQYVGYIFQFYNLIPDLTVRENIEVCRSLTKTPLAIDELIATLNLTEQQHKFPNQLSGGQQQRCAIGRALVKNPPLLICDELTGALDYKTSKEILALVADINRRYGTTVIIVTHNEVIGQMADVVYKLRDGQVVATQRNQNKVDARDLEW